MAKARFCEEPTGWFVDDIRVPDAVVQAISLKFKDCHEFTQIMEQLGYNYLSKYFYFTHANMFHGVEPDGHIHT